MFFLSQKSPPHVEQQSKDDDDDVEIIIPDELPPPMPNQHQPGPNRTGSLKKALTTSDEDDEVDSEETRPLQRLPKPQVKPNNSHSSTSDYHSDENPNLLPVEHRELPGFRLQHFNNRYYPFQKQVLLRRIFSLESTLLKEEGK